LSLELSVGEILCTGSHPATTVAAAVFSAAKSEYLVSGRLPE
jgi:hypothetical protein